MERRCAMAKTRKHRHPRRKGRGKKRRSLRSRRPDPGQKTEHHRKPRRHGGNGDNGNIITLPRWEHEAYHTLFNHLRPWDVAVQINVWEMLPSLVSCKLREEASLSSLISHFLVFCDCSKVSCRKPLSIRPSVKQRIAWKTLFEGKSEKDILRLINERYLDSDYKLFFAI